MSKENWEVQEKKLLRALSTMFMTVRSSFHAKGQIQMA